MKMMHAITFAAILSAAHAAASAQTNAESKAAQEQRAYIAGMSSLAKDEKASLSAFAGIKSAVAQVFAGKDGKAVEKAMAVGELLDEARADQQQVAEKDAKAAATATDEFHRLGMHVPHHSKKTAFLQSQGRSTAEARAMHALRMQSLASRENDILHMTERAEDAITRDLTKDGSHAAMATEHEVISMLEQAKHAAEAAYTAANQSAHAAKAAAVTKKAVAKVNATKAVAASKKPAVAPKPRVVPVGKQAVTTPQPVHVVSKAAATTTQPAAAAKVAHTAVKAGAAQPIVHAHVQVVASAPAASPAAAPAGADWGKEYKHAKDPDQLKWKWTTNKPGSYDVSQKAPPKLLPIGEGAYQSAEAVAQRTKDINMHCEEGKWNDCMLKHGGDFVDGHTYGNLKGKYGNNIPKRSGAAASTLGLAVVSLFFTALSF